MRHFFTRPPLLGTGTGAIAALACGVTVPAAPALLIAAPRRAQALTAGRRRAGATAVLLAAITARADAHLAPAARTHEQPGIVHDALPAMSAGRPLCGR